MKAPLSLFAVVLMLSCASHAQTAPTPQSPPTQQAVPAAEPSKPEAEGQAATTSPAAAASAPSTEAVDASAGAGPAAASMPLPPGAKIFIEPMEGFEKLVAQSIEKHKVPVVLVTEREKAEFVMSGEAHLKKPGWITGTLFATPHGKGDISIKDARTGNEVFFYKFTRVDTDKTNYQVYQAWANACADHVKRAIKKEEKAEKK